MGSISEAVGGSTQGIDFQALLPVFNAIVKDPNARGELPGLVQQIVAGGDGGTQNLQVSNIINAVLGDKDALAAVPQLLGLLQQLGIPLSFGQR